MTVLEAKEAICKAAEAAEHDFYYVGFRFENLNRKVGDVCGNSKHNPDREDVRDFPEYGTEEYNELPELDGTCAYIMGGIDWNFSREDYAKSCKDHFIGDHCYVIASDDAGNNDDPDAFEILLRRPVVVAKIF